MNLNWQCVKASRSWVSTCGPKRKPKQNCEIRPSKAAPHLLQRATKDHRFWQDDVHAEVQSKTV